MNRSRFLKVMTGHVLLGLLVTSIAVAQTSVTVKDRSTVRTMALDPSDYNRLATELAQSILTDPVLPLDDTRVLALGPVDTDGCKYAFDIRLFQEKLQTILLRSRKIKVTFAVDALKKDSAAEARYDVMMLQWQKESTVSPEDLRVFGGLAKVDYLLFGRLVAQDAPAGARKPTEVTYTFNWKLGDTEQGLLVWADERQIVKSRTAQAK